MAKEDDNTVSFRLPPEAHEELLRLSGAARSSKHQTARTLLIQALSGGGTPPKAAAPAIEPSDIEEAFQVVITHLSDLRTGVGRGVGAILLHVAPDMDKEKIRRWVVDNIITPSTRPEAEERDPC